jgi:hypothetical protein
MSAALLLNLEYSNLKGKAFLPCKEKIKGKKLKVGIRWSGNPDFEHEQHRKFNPEPLFNLKNVDLVSLQRDSLEEIPNHIGCPSLDSWEDTIEAIESVDLVITSCTSVAHLAGAMGKPTWIIIPILPYYLWAIPGQLTPWYNSVKLFRQTKKDEWSNVFEEITKELELLI